MSYCRWSSEAGTCAVYVYEDVAGGWTTQIAGRKRIPIIPRPPTPKLSDGVDIYVAMNQELNKWFDDPTNYTWENLPEEYAGKMYNDPTPGECAERLIKIREAGLNVPQYVIDALMEEESERVR